MISTVLPIYWFLSQNFYISLFFILKYFFGHGINLRYECNFFNWLFSFEIFFSLQCLWIMIQIIEYIFTIIDILILYRKFPDFFRFSRVSSQVTLINRKFINRNALITVISISHIKKFEICCWPEWILILIWIIDCWWINNEFRISKGWLIMDTTTLTVL